MREKDLIKKHKKVPPFLRARVEYEKVKLLRILYILPTEKRKGKKKGGEMNWFRSE
jgi:hypothetical protein